MAANEHAVRRKCALGFADIANVRTVARVLCSYLPHGMHPTCKLLTFLRLRAASKACIQSVTSQLGWRVAILLEHHDKSIREHAKKVKDSGFILQCRRFCGHYKDSHNGLLRMGSVGIPEGMTQAYWDDAVKELRKLGWDGNRLYL